MKRRLILWGLCALMTVSGSALFSSCAPKSGCPAESARETAIHKSKKKKRGKTSQLFPKDIRKQM